MHLTRQPNPVLYAFKHWKLSSQGRCHGRGRQERVIDSQLDRQFGTITRTANHSNLRGHLRGRSRCSHRYNLDDNFLEKEQGRN